MKTLTAIPTKTVEIGKTIYIGTFAWALINAIMGGWAYLTSVDADAFGKKRDYRILVSDIERSDYEIK